MTTKRMIVGGLVVIAALGAIYALLKLVPGGEEPPIRVKNGSMEIELCDGSSWKYDKGDWIPPTGESSGQNFFWVTISSTSTSPGCQSVTRTANVVHLYYKDESQARAQIVYGMQTRVKPRDNKPAPDPNRPHILVYGVPKETGQYINKIDVLGGGGQPLSCSFESAQELNHIIICSSNAQGDCGTCK